MRRVEGEGLPRSARGCAAGLLVAAFLVALCGAARAAQPGPSVLVQVTRLHAGGLPRIVTVYGRMEVDPAARHAVTAPAAVVVDAISVQPGQQVAAGAPLVGLGPSPATSSAYTQAVAAVRVAGELARRTAALVAQHLATRQDLAAAEKSGSDARAALAALAAEGAAGPRTLRAPFAAVVTAVPARRGAIVAQGTALVDLARPDALVLHAGAVPSQAAAIRPGDRAAILALGGGEPAAGKVLLRGSMVDPQTGLVPVIVAPPAGRFLLGETAQARIVTGETRGWVVPHVAMLVDDSGVPYVVQAKDGIAHRVRVRILGHDGERDVVAGSLDPAASLVLAGNYQLADGMRVRVK
jgi:membrane fusion protein, multidrug efflux system